MPQRTPNVNRSWSVNYRNTRGRTSTATIIGAGTSGGTTLKLRVYRGTGGHGVIVDNVAKATSEKQTNVYFSRTI